MAYLRRIVDRVPSRLTKCPRVGQLITVTISLNSSVPLSRGFVKKRRFVNLWILPSSFRREFSLSQLSDHFKAAKCDERIWSIQRISIIFQRTGESISLFAERNIVSQVQHERQ